jgi:hypothetical protein
MRKSNEILVFSIIACAILVLEFFYLPWGSINKNSTISSNNITQSVQFEGGAPNTSTFSDASYGGGFSPQISNTSSSFSHRAFSHSAVKTNRTATYSVLRSSTDDDNRVTSFGGVVGGNELAGASYTNTSHNLSSDVAPSFNVGGFSSSNGLALQSRQEKGLNKLFQNNSGGAEVDFNSGLSKVSMGGGGGMIPPPAVPLDASEILYLLLMIYLVVKYIQSISRRKATQKKHVI